jgi:hypothetical protein
MKKLHAKSPCCQGDVKRYGNRRRQCAVCQQTWRVRKKKRGRKIKREQDNLLIRYLQHEVPSLYAWAHAKNQSEHFLQARLNRSLRYFLRQTSWPALPKEGNLVLLADAMLRYVENEWRTFYLVAVKNTWNNYAVIVPPFIHKDRETFVGWQKALNRLPEEIKARIKAIVCDGHRGLIYYAKSSGWLIQRCHFHLIASIQSRRSKWRYSRHRAEGQHIYDLVNHVLTTLDEKAIIESIAQIEKLAWCTKSQKLRKILSGFVTHYQEFRTYLYYPELNLPKTNNTMESLIGAIQHLCHRARGFCTLASFERWICAIIKHKKKIKCNGSHQPN